MVHLSKWLKMLSYRKNSKSKPLAIYSAILLDCQVTVRTKTEAFRPPGTSSGYRFFTEIKRNIFVIFEEKFIIEELTRDLV